MAALTVADPILGDVLLKLREQSFLFFFLPHRLLRKRSSYGRAEGIMGSMFLV